MSTSGRCLRRAWARLPTASAHLTELSPVTAATSQHLRRVSQPTAHTDVFLWQGTLLPPSAASLIRQAHPVSAHPSASVPGNFLTPDSPITSSAGARQAQKRLRLASEWRLQQTTDSPHPPAPIPALRSPVQQAPSISQWHPGLPTTTPQPEDSSAALECPASTSQPSEAPSGSGDSQPCPPPLQCNQRGREYQPRYRKRFKKHGLEKR